MIFPWVCLEFLSTWFSNMQKHLDLLRATLVYPRILELHCSAMITPQLGNKTTILVWKWTQLCGHWFFWLWNNFETLCTAWTYNLHLQNTVTQVGHKRSHLRSLWHFALSLLGLPTTWSWESWFWSAGCLLY